MKLYIWILLTAITFVGCKNDTNQEEGDIAYLGGEVISPINKTVYISDANKVIDTLTLNSKNRFIYKVKNLKSGLYSFRLQSTVGLEYQLVLLEPNDSIIFRVNTLDFDESLIYTGKGAKKNNYLINEFLENELEEKHIIELFQLHPLKFEKKIDSIYTLKLHKLNAFKTKYETSNLFNTIAESNINYNYYSNKELYPFIHYGENKHSILQSIPKDFYSYRKSVDYSDSLFKDQVSYNKFLEYNLSNLALTEHIKHSEDCSFNRMSLCYNLDRLHIVDSLLVTNSQMKDDLLYNFSINYITNSRNEKNNNAILKFYVSKSENEGNKEKMTRYVNSLNNLKFGAKMPEIKLLDYNNTELSINSIVDSPTVISFWSQKYYKHFKQSHYKFKELKAKYPEVKLIMINIDNLDIETLTKSLNRNHFPLNNEYKLKTPDSTIKELALHAMTKTIILDKHKKIVNSNANIFAINFEEQLLGLINR